MYIYIYVHTYAYGGNKLADTQAAETQHYRRVRKHMRNTDGRRRNGGLYFFGWGRYCKRKTRGEVEEGERRFNGGRGHHSGDTTPESSICVYIGEGGERRFNGVVSPAMTLPSSPSLPPITFSSLSTAVCVTYESSHVPYA